MIEAGTEIELVYPRNTHVLHIEASPRLVRSVYVHRVRDLIANPLTPNEYFRRPYVARSRWIILGTEDIKEPPRQFYLGSADNFRAPGVLQLATYKPGSDRPHQFLYRQFEPTPFDRRELMRAINRSLDEYPDMDLRVTAPDMRGVF